MMKIVLFLLLTNYLFFTNSNVKSEDCIIVPNKGINNIVIGKSTLKDVQKEFGAKRVKKKWHKAIEVELFGKYEYYLEYDSIATFSTITKGRNKNIIYKIIIESDSKCKTKGGNGIDSSYNDIIEELGEGTLTSFSSTNENPKIEIRYNDMLVIFNNNDKKTARVEKMIIW